MKRLILKTLGLDRPDTTRTLSDVGVTAIVGLGLASVLGGLKKPALNPLANALATVSLLALVFSRGATNILES